MRAFDTDGDLKNVKVIARFKDGTKTKVALVDNGLGQFTGVVELDTATAQRVGLEIKAKDEAKQKVKRGAIVTVVDTAAVPTLSDVVIAPAVLEAGSGLQIVTVSVQVVDPDGDLKNVKLEQLAKPGKAARMEKFGKLLDDGTGADVTANDGRFTIQIVLPTDEVGPDSVTPEGHRFCKTQSAAGSRCRGAERYTGAGADRDHARSRHHRDHGGPDRDRHGKWRRRFSKCGAMGRWPPS